MVLTKLLIFKINTKNLEEWEIHYYEKYLSTNSTERYSRGIAQGLPQSYFFGNLCMVEIRKRILEHKDFKDCDSFFYVDDSVIYIGQEYDLTSFKSTISELNSSVKAIGNGNKYEGVRQTVKGILGEDYIKFQKELDTIIRFHDEEKSKFCRIEEAGMSIAGLAYIIHSRKKVAVA